MTEAVKEAAEHATEQGNASLKQAIQLLEEAMGPAEQTAIETLAPQQAWHSQAQVG